MRRVLLGAVFFLISVSIWPQVAVVRTLPVHGPNPVEPEWTEPSPSLSQSERTQIDGRLAVGATAGSLTAETWIYALFLDGSLFLIQNIGSGTLAVSSELLRKQKTQGFGESYKGEMLFGTDLFDVGIAGTYESAAINDADTTSVLLSLTHGLFVLDSLPIELGAEYSSEFKTTDDVIDADTQEWLLKLGADGKIGTVGVEFATSYQSEDDFLQAVRSTQMAGSISVSAPVARSLSLTASVEPAYSGGLAETTKLDTSLGVDIQPSDGVMLALAGGRNDTWTDIHTKAWLLSAASEVSISERFSVSAGYETSIPSALQDLIHRIDGGLQWTPDPAVFGVELATFTASATLDQHVKLQSSSDVSFKPAAGMEISSSYTNSYSDDTDDGWSVVHDADLLVSHTVAELIGYGFGVGMEYNEGSMQTFDQEYSGTLNLNPLIEGSRYPFSASEKLIIVSEEGLASSLSVSAQVPLLPEVIVAYGFTWDRVEQNTDWSDSFNHTTGLVFNLPSIDFTADYGFTHGDLGLRHDIRGALTLPVTSWLGIHAEMELSRYNDATGLQTPFLLSIASTYEF